MSTTTPLPAGAAPAPAPATPATPPAPGAPAPGADATPPPPPRRSRFTKNQQNGGILILVLLGLVILFFAGRAFFGSGGKAEGDQLAALRKELADLKAEKAASPAPTPPAQTSGAPAEAPPQGSAVMAPGSVGFHPASPDKRFLQPPPAEIANGNADGSIAVQATPDCGIIYPRPQGPSHTREAMIAAAKKAGLESLALACQGCSLDKFELGLWPSTEPKLDASGKQIVDNGVPQWVMYHVLRSPSVTTIRHKDDVPGASGMSVEAGQSSLPPRSQAGGPPTRPMMGSQFGGQQGRPKMRPPGNGSGGPTMGNGGQFAGRLTPSGKPDKCPHCGQVAQNAPNRPYPCQACNKLVEVGD